MIDLVCACVCWMECVPHGVWRLETNFVEPVSSYLIWVPRMHCRFPCLCGDSFGFPNHLIGRSFCLIFESRFLTVTWGSPIMHGEPQGSTSFYYPSAGIKRQSCLTVPLPPSHVGSVYQIHAFTDRAISLAPFHILF